MYKQSFIKITQEYTHKSTEEPWKWDIGHSWEEINRLDDSGAENIEWKSNKSNEKLLKY